MKTLAKLIVFVLSITFANAQEKTGNSITVTIDNVRNDKGTVMFGLHTAETFMKAQGVQGTQSKIVDGKVTVTFKNVQPGTYAILALHDENNNKLMDFKENGMPNEDYGTSNNVMSFGPPNFNESKFEVQDKDLSIHIRF